MHRPIIYLSLSALCLIAAILAQVLIEKSIWQSTGEDPNLAEMIVVTLYITLPLAILSVGLFIVGIILLIKSRKATTKK